MLYFYIWKHVIQQLGGTSPKQVKMWNNLLLKGVWTAGRHFSLWWATSQTCFINI